jgi:hypothetical protein
MKFSYNMEKFITNTRINSTNFNPIKEFKKTQNNSKYTLIISQLYQISDITALNNFWFRKTMKKKLRIYNYTKYPKYTLIKSEPSQISSLL